MQTPLLLVVLSAITPITIIFLSSINYYWDYFQNSYTQDASAEVYDFIVGKLVFSLYFGYLKILACFAIVAVGSGSSGAVVAYRLVSQNYKVLLLEAGGDPTYLSSIPGFALDLIGYNEHDWNYKSVPQKDVALSHHNQVKVSLF